MHTILIFTIKMHTICIYAYKKQQGTEMLKCLAASLIFHLFFQLSETIVPLIAAIECCHAGKATLRSDLIDGLPVVFGIIQHFYHPLDPNVIDEYA